MELANQHSFLVLELADNSGRLALRIEHSLKSVFRNWKPSTRISPIFGVKELGTGSLRRFQFTGKSSLIFLGPIPPERILECGVQSLHAWLTLGLFNIIVHSTDIQTKNQILRWAKDQKTPIETWSLVDGELQHTKVALGHQKEDRSWRLELSKLFHAQLSPELSQTVKDYCPLMATTLARSASLPQELSEDLQKTHQYVIDTLEDYENAGVDTSPYPTLGEVLTVHAGLTRFTSQTLAGIEQISTRECHLRAHSLLGIGVPNIALAHLRQFLESTLGSARLPERIAALSSVTKNVPNLCYLPDDDSFWTKDHLAEVELPLETNMPEVPLLSYFSARDGFRSTLTTISAPLNSISACNSVHWSLLTVTHEYSHVLIKTIMADLYPDLEDEADVSNVLALFEPGRVGKNLFEEIRRLLLFTLVYMDRDAIPLEKDELDITVDRLKALLDQRYREAQEILVHVFDFLYFYGSDIDKYVEGIWISWGTIPNINNRVKEYVVRTICAAMVNNLRRPKPEEMARDQVVRSLSELKKRGDGGTYIQRALDYIDEHWDDQVFVRVFLRRDLVRIARAFLFSETIASQVRRETELKGGEPSHKEGYDLAARFFESREILNPIHFLELYTKSKSPSVVDSAWMFYILAFYMRGNVS